MDLGGLGRREQPNESDDFRQVNIIYVTSSAARHVPKIFLASKAELRFDLLANMNERYTEIFQTFPF